MAAGDQIPTTGFGAWRFLYENPLGGRSKPLLGDLPNALADQTNPRDRVRVAPQNAAMLEGGYLVLQHKSTGSTQTHDSDVMIVEIPITVIDKATGQRVAKTLLNTDRDTTRLADDRPGASVFVDVQVYKIPAGQIYVLGNTEQPFLRLVTKSTA